MGDIIVLTVIGICVALAVRSMWKDHKNGGGCAGCSHNCAGCKSACRMNAGKVKV